MCAVSVVIFEFLIFVMLLKCLNIQKLARLMMSIVMYLMIQ